MQNNNKKIFIWYRISFFSILFKYNSKHYFLYCDSKTYTLLKFLNYDVYKINYEEHIFDLKKNNYFFKSDFFIDKCSRKILSYFKYDTFNFEKKDLVNRIYLSFIAQDIKDNSNFFIRTKDFFLKKFPKNKIIYKFDDCDFSNIFCSILIKKYKKINFSFSKRFLKVSLFKKVIFLHLTLILNNFRQDMPRKNKPVIFQEYLDNIFDRYPDAGHLFWIDKSKIKFSNINWFTFNRKLENFSFKNPITKRNEYLINVNKFNILKFNNIYNDYSFLDFLKKFFPLKNKLFIFFLLEFFVKYKIENYKQLIKNNNIKIFHHYQEPNFENLSLAYSCKISDCVFIWNHWSVDQHPIFYFKYGFCDIFLSWGTWNTSYLNAHNFIYDYIFTTGMIGGDKFKNSSKKTSSKKKLIIFDSSSDAKSLHHPNFLLEEFYEKILSLASKEKYEIFVKPKRNIYNNISIKLSSRLRNAIKKRKINIISNILTPSKVGNVNDLYIAWGQNTAGNIANIQGKNVLYFDNIKLKFHPFAKKSFTVKNLKNLENKIESYFNNKQKYNLKNYEKKYLNEFFDTKTTERGSFIFKKTFDYLNKKGKEKALAEVAKEFQSKYGKNKIISKKGRIKTNKIWEKEIKKIEKLYEKII